MLSVSTCYRLRKHRLDVVGFTIIFCPPGYHRDNRGNILFPRQAGEWKPKFTPVLPTATTPASVWRTQGHDDHHPHKFYHPIPYWYLASKANGILIAHIPNLAAFAFFTNVSICTQVSPSIKNTNFEMKEIEINFILKIKSNLWRTRLNQNLFKDAFETYWCLKIRSILKIC